MTKQKTDETTLQFVTAFLKSQKGKYEDTQIHLDRVLGLPDHQNDELVWFFKACMFQKMGKTQQSHDCLQMALMSFDYPANITLPSVESIASNTIPHSATKLDYVI
jgi:Tfp pilus assembly protein PilF